MDARTIPTGQGVFTPGFYGGVRQQPSYSMFGNNGSQAAQPVPVQQYNPQSGWQNQHSSLFGMQAAPPVPPVKQYKPPTGWQNQPLATDDCNQLDLNSLMPLSWREAGADVLTGNDRGWSRNAVTKEGYNKYISAQGGIRTCRSDRSAHGKIVGNTMGINSFRTEALPALSLGEDAVVFNDSSERQALVSSTYKNYMGCGF